MHTPARLPSLLVVRVRDHREGTEMKKRTTPTVHVHTTGTVTVNGEDTFDTFRVFICTDSYKFPVGPEFHSMRDARNYVRKFRRAVKLS